MGSRQSPRFRRYPLLSYKWLHMTEMFCRASGCLLGTLAFVLGRVNRNSSAIAALVTCNRIPLVAHHTPVLIHTICQRRGVVVAFALPLPSPRKSALDVPYLHTILIAISCWNGKSRQLQPQRPRRASYIRLFRIRRSLPIYSSCQDATAHVRGDVGHHALQ
jgi:hypothetical protein